MLAALPARMLAAFPRAERPNAPAPEFQVERDWDQNDVTSWLWEAGGVLQASIAACSQSGPCDPGSSLTAVNHLFWFLPTRRLAAAPCAGAVGVGEMHGSWAGASPAGRENQRPTGPWPCQSTSSRLLLLGVLYGSNLPRPHHPAMHQEVRGVAEERLPEMKAQEGDQLGLLLEGTVQGRCLTVPRDTSFSASSSPSPSPRPSPPLSPAPFSHLPPHTPPLHPATSRPRSDLPNRQSGMLVWQQRARPRIGNVDFNRDLERNC